MCEDFFSLGCLMDKLDDLNQKQKCEWLLFLNLKISNKFLLSASVILIQTLLPAFSYQYLR